MKIGVRNLKKHQIVERGVILMSDPYMVRDSEGDPESSIFGNFQKNPLLKLISFLYPNEAFIIHDLDETVTKKYFREYRERKEAEK